MSDYGSEGWGFEYLRARSESRRSEQVSTLTASTTESANCARGGAHNGQEVAPAMYQGADSALLMGVNATEQIETVTTEQGERELVYRQGFGWVSRLVESTS
jgi:hypothetical protein